VDLLELLLSLLLRFLAPRLVCLPLRQRQRQQQQQKKVRYLYQRKDLLLLLGELTDRLHRLCGGRLRRGFFLELAQLLLRVPSERTIPR
jgi:hypothetical protein